MLRLRSLASIAVVNHCMPCLMASLPRTCLAAITALALAAAPVAGQAPPAGPELGLVEGDAQALLRPDLTGQLEAYSFETFTRQAASVPWELAGLTAFGAVLGFKTWDWGSSSEFKFHPEGWFGDKTGSGGMDKLGHAFSTYVVTDLLTDRIIANGGGSGAAITAGLLSMGLMTAVEIVDGFSADHGFAREDMVMNALGAGFSVLRSTMPGLKEKVDFRLQYFPSPHSSFRPLSDYMGQRYLLAVKLAGFETFEQTPLRYFEVQGGYFARGFSKQEKLLNLDRDREFYVGVGFNFGEILFGSGGPFADTRAAPYGRKVFEYVQPPFSAFTTDNRR